MQSKDIIKIVNYLSNPHNFEIRAILFKYFIQNKGKIHKENIEKIKISVYRSPKTNKHTGYSINQTNFTNEKIVKYLNDNSNIFIFKHQYYYIKEIYYVFSKYLKLYKK